MNERLPPLDSRLIESLRADHAAPSQARDRVRARLEAAIPSMRPGGGGGEGSGGADGAPGVGGAAASLASHTFAFATAAFLLGGIVGATLYAQLAKPPPPKLVYVDRPAATDAAPTIHQAPLPKDPPAVASAAPAPPVPPASASNWSAEKAPLAATARPVPPAVGHSPLQSQLSVERALLDDARAELAQGRPETSLEQLARHRRQFPGGLLGEERDAMEIEALVRSGQFDQAVSRAEEFRKRTPRSIFLPAVEATMSSAR